MMQDVPMLRVWLIMSRYYHYQVIPPWFMVILGWNAKQITPKDHAPRVPTPFNQHTMEYQQWWDIVRLIPLSIKDEKGDEEEEDEEAREEEGYQEETNMVGEEPMDVGNAPLPTRPKKPYMPSSSRFAAPLEDTSSLLRLQGFGLQTYFLRRKIDNKLFVTQDWILIQRYYKHRW